MTKKIVNDQPELSEDDLRQFYQALVLSGTDAADQQPSLLQIEAPSGLRGLPEPHLGEEERIALLDGLRMRLIGTRPEAQRDGTDQKEVIDSNGDAGPQTQRNRSLVDWQQRKAAVRAHIEDILDVLAALPPVAGQQSGQLLPLGIVSRKEWSALFETSVSGCVEAHGKPADYYSSTCMNPRPPKLFCR